MKRLVTLLSFLSLFLSRCEPAWAAQLDGAVRYNSGTSGTNTTSASVTVSSRTNLNAGAMYATNSVNVGRAGEAGIITLTSTNGTYTVTQTVDANGVLTVNGIGPTNLFRLTSQGTNVLTTDTHGNMESGYTAVYGYQPSYVLGALRYNNETAGANLFLESLDSTDFLADAWTEIVNETTATNEALAYWDMNAITFEGAAALTGRVESDSDPMVRLQGYFEGRGFSLEPTSPDGDAPYEFDTITTHTTGDLMAVYNNTVLAFNVAAVSGYAGGGTKALFDDGTYKTVTSGTVTNININPTTGYIPYRSNATVFGDSPLFRRASDAVANGGYTLLGTTNQLPTFATYQQTLGIFGTPGIPVFNLDVVQSGTTYPVFWFYTQTNGPAREAFYLQSIDAGTLGGNSRLIYAENLTRTTNSTAQVDSPLASAFGTIGIYGLASPNDYPNLMTMGVFGRSDGTGGTNAWNVGVGATVDTPLPASTNAALHARVKGESGVHAGALVETRLASGDNGAVNLATSAVLVLDSGLTGDTLIDGRSGNGATNQFKVAYPSGYTGAGTLFLSDDGTYQAVTSPPGATVTNVNINPTDGYYPYRSNSTTFGDGRLIKDGTNTVNHGKLFVYGPVYGGTYTSNFLGSLFSATPRPGFYAVSPFAQDGMGVARLHIAAADSTSGNSGSYLDYGPFNTGSATNGVFQMNSSRSSGAVSRNLYLKTDVADPAEHYLLLTSNSTPQIRINGYGQIQFGTGATNNLTWNGTDLVYTNGASGVVMSIKNGSGQTASIGMNSGGDARFSTDQSSLTLVNATKSVSLGASGFTPLVSLNLGGNTSTTWVDESLQGNLYIYGAGVGTVDYERLSISATTTTNGAIYNMTVGGSGTYRNQTFQIGSTNIIQLNPSEISNETGLLLRENGTMSRVKVGAAGTGPGGSGRALYID